MLSSAKNFGRRIWDSFFTSGIGNSQYNRIHINYTKSFSSSDEQHITQALQIVSSLKDKLNRYKKTVVSRYTSLWYWLYCEER
jgi:hypothetical protein